MTKDDTALCRASDVLAAVGLLSRLPVPVDMEQAKARGARGAWAYPLAGVVLGTIAALIASVAVWAGLSAPIAAGLTLATTIIISGAMHEDGLADSVDGLWGGWDRTRRLEIMKDSRIGAYGVLAIVLTLGLRWVALTAILAADAHWPVLIAVAALSRAAMVPVMAGLPHARSDGLSRHVGRPPAQTAWLALAVGVVVCLLTLGLTTLPVLIITALVVTIWAATAHQKIGGQTGDILGATQQWVEIALLIYCTTL